MQSLSEIVSQIVREIHLNFFDLHKSLFVGKFGEQKCEELKEFVEKEDFYSVSEILDRMSESVEKQVYELLETFFLHLKTKWKNNWRRLKGERSLLFLML